MRQDFEKGKIENSGEGEIYPYSASSVDCPIVKEVLQGLDLKDWALSLGIMDFLKVHKMKLEKEESREVLGRIESEEGIDAVVSLFRAFIQRKAALYRLKVANQKYYRAEDDLQIAIEIFEGFEEIPDWTINLPKLLIVKENAEKEKMAFYKVYEFAKSMGDRTAPIPLESIRNGELPDDLIEAIKEIPRFNIRKFLEGLANFLLETGADGNCEIIHLCEDIDVLKEITRIK